MRKTHCRHDMRPHRSTTRSFASRLGGFLLNTSAREPIAPWDARPIRLSDEAIYVHAGHLDSSQCGEHRAGTIVRVRCANPMLLQPGMFGTCFRGRRLSTGMLIPTARLTCARRFLVVAANGTVIALSACAITRRVARDPHGLNRTSNLIAGLPRARRPKGTAPAGRIRCFSQEASAGSLSRSCATIVVRTMRAANR